MKDFRMKVRSGFIQHQFGAGFTLIELLIVIAVVGVLAGGVMTIINPSAQFQKARDARRKSDLTQIQKALESYYSDNGKYPYTSSKSGSYCGGPDWGITDLVNGKCKAFEWGSSGWQYMGALPKDPSFPSRYYTYYSDNNTRQFYILYTALEEAGDPQLCTGVNRNICTAFKIKCGDNNLDCNYGVASPNARLDENY